MFPNDQVGPLMLDRPDVLWYKLYKKLKLVFVENRTRVLKRIHYVKNVVKYLYDSLWFPEL